ncbi:MAG: regulatory protein RecX [Clostridia bacterium]|nr:regulatory protein RecX [Clostridia bacterium]MBR4659728.1 regulatory protein RecX [Clostridia bacterium]MBR6109760.1 regulatory protein RecX [Clostridia bacterium]
MAQKKQKEDRKKTTVSAYDAALKFLTPKARTVREVELKLDEGCYSEGEIMMTVERLTEAGLLDDRKYASDFVESRLSTKPVSKFRLSEQLRAHFVPREVIDSVLDSLADGTESENAVKVAEKFMRQFESIDDEEERTKRVYARLRTRGYDHDTITEAIRACTEDRGR